MPKVCQCLNAPLNEVTIHNFLKQGGLIFAHDVNLAKCYF